MSGHREFLLICFVFCGSSLDPHISNAQDELRDQLLPSVMPLGTIDGEIPSSDFLPDFSGADQNLFGFGYSPEGIRAFLQSFQSPDDEITREHLTSLTSHDYAVRHRALVQLINASDLNRELVSQSIESADLDLRVQIAQVLSLNDIERTHAKITFAFRVIIEKEVQGLALDLVRIIEDQSINNETSIKLCTQAFDITLVPDDAPLLKETLTSEKDLVRFLTVRGLIALQGRSALPIIIPLVEDPYDEICYLVTQFAAVHHHQACLKGYVQLLTSDTFAYRWQSLEKLRRLTGQDFGYFAAGEKEERTEAAAKWREWIEQQGEKIQIDFSKLESARNQ